jgi:hypothetical protein
MRKRDGRLIFSPTDLLVFFRSQFASWTDRFLVERPGTLTADASDSIQELLIQQGQEHERRYVASLSSLGTDVREPPPGARLADWTHVVMRRRARYPRWSPRSWRMGRNARSPTASRFAVDARTLELRSRRLQARKDAAAGVSDPARCVRRLARIRSGTPADVPNCHRWRRTIACHSNYGRLLPLPGAEGCIPRVSGIVPSRSAADS